MSFVSKIINKYFSDRRFVVSSKYGVTYYNLKTSYQLCVLFFICILLGYMSYISIDSYVKNSKIRHVYQELDSVKKVNDNLVEHVELINKDLSVLAKHFGNAIPSSQKAKKLGNRDDVARQLKAESLNNVAAVMNGLNGTMANMVKTLESTDLRLSYFMKNAANISKVKSALFTVDSDDFNNYELYKTNSYNYYFRSAAIDGSGISDDAIADFIELNRIMRKMPIRDPFNGDFMITSSYGVRRDPFAVNSKRMHHGIDLHGKVSGATILAVGDGVAGYVGRHRDFGNMVEIQHWNAFGTKIISRYAHLKSLNVKTGQLVSAGSIIGRQGATGGMCKGEHLHLEIRLNNKSLNPANFIYAHKNVSNKAIVRRGK